ncbi:pilus assembly protein TadG-related protein [Streptomyces sp. NBC_00826]|uniref:pilus assembly protein TadG-related protein n=2 Tax=unclassified Streptomyces TaxID=2593676 RepID=UPI00386757E7|nr:pilus assembly protein TadG-related protein [Streptomyces sp. NBC_00826]WTB60710.1 pilus assembly protein TadG-related protein [Streptomyces sp. NBC_00826]
MPPAHQPPGRQRGCRGRQLRGQDDGSVTMFWLVCSVAALGLLALLVDGGGILRAKAHADDLAAEAARAAGQQIDLSQAIPGTALVIDPDAAQQAAEAFLSQAGVHGTVTVSADGTRITVDVTGTYTTVMVSAVGYTDVPISGHSSAELVRQMEG